MLIASITALFIYYTAFRKLKYHFKHIFFLNLQSGYSTTVKRDHAKENIVKNIFRNRKKYLRKHIEKLTEKQITNVRGFIVKQEKKSLKTQSETEKKSLK